MYNLHAKLSGVFTALVTPFNDQKEIDEKAFLSLLDTQLEAGIAGLVPVGTTGESATLEEAERDFLIKTTVSKAKGHAFVMAGTGSNSTKKAVAWTKKAEDMGVDGCLVVAPYYNKPTQAGVYDYFGEVASNTALPIILYSVPGRCGIEIAPETAARLAADFDNIVAIKEAGGSVDRVTDLRQACGDDFIIQSGDDGLTIPFMSAGAVGVISVLSNVMPELMVALVDAWYCGDMEKALELHEKVHGLAAAMFVESNPTPAKYALSLMGKSSPFVRSPLVELSPAGRSVVEAALA